MATQQVTRQRAYTQERVRDVLNEHGYGDISVIHKPDYLFIMTTVRNRQDIQDLLNEAIEGVQVKNSSQNEGTVLRYKKVEVPKDWEATQKERPQAKTEQPIPAQATKDPQETLASQMQDIGIAVSLKDGMVPQVTDLGHEKIIAYINAKPALIKSTLIRKMVKVSLKSADLVTQINYAFFILNEKGLDCKFDPDVQFDDKKFPQGRSNPLIFTSKTKRNQAIKILKGFLNVQEHDEKSIFILPFEAKTRRGKGTRSEISTFLIEKCGIPSSAHHSEHFLNVSKVKTIYLYDFSPEDLELLTQELSREFPEETFWIKGENSISYGKPKKPRKKGSKPQAKKKEKQPEQRPAPSENIPTEAVVNSVINLLQALPPEEQQKIAKMFFTPPEVEVKPLTIDDIKSKAQELGFSLIKSDAILS